MSRTYREIPDNGVRNRDERNCRFALEEKKGRGHNTKTVRDKDNHGCLYSKPSDYKRRHNRRYRRTVNQELKKIKQHLWNNPTDKIGFTYIKISVDDLDITLPKPEEYQPYYW